MRPVSERRASAAAGPGSQDGRDQLVVDASVRRWPRRGWSRSSHGPARGRGWRRWTSRSRGGDPERDGEHHQRCPGALRQKSRTPLRPPAPSPRPVIGRHPAVRRRPSGRRVPTACSWSRSRLWCRASPCRKKSTRRGPSSSQVPGGLARDDDRRIVRGRARSPPAAAGLRRGPTAACPPGPRSPPGRAARARAGGAPMAPCQKSMEA